MNFAVAIRTVPKRRQLFAELMAEPALVHYPSFVQNVSVRSNDKVSPNENGCQALELALFGRDGNKQENIDWIIFMEDDAGLTVDFFGSTQRWLTKHEQEDVHIYPLGCQYKEAWPKDTDVWQYPIKAFYCSVAMVIRASLVPSLISYLRNNAHVKQGFDIMSGHWHKTLSSSIYLLTPIPCFVEHLGDESTLIEGRPDRNVVGRFRGFPGREYVYCG